LQSSLLFLQSEFFVCPLQNESYLGIALYQIIQIIYIGALQHLNECTQQLQNSNSQHPSVQLSETIASNIEKQYRTNDKLSFA
jgi:hypothetical protein